jgi:hypothetical protein
LLTDLIHQRRGYTISPSCFVARRREDQYWWSPHQQFVDHLGHCRPGITRPFARRRRQSTNCCGST